MNHEPPNLDDDALLAMAYVDGELPPDQRKAFEARLIHEPELSSQVAEMSALALVARDLIPPEPEDREWRRLGRDPLQLGGLRLVWVLWVVAAAGLAVALAHAVANDGAHWGVRVFLFTGSAGALLLLGLTLRERLAVLPFDFYRKLQR